MFIIFEKKKKSLIKNIYIFKKRENKECINNHDIYGYINVS